MDTEPVMPAPKPATPITLLVSVGWAFWTFWVAEPSRATNRLAVVPVEMKLLDSDVAIEAMLARIAERTKIQPQTQGELSSRSQL